jgi:NAD(P)-dependent dehydrogenase (short-subunit alcohol dehydrogenase family)
VSVGIVVGATGGIGAACARALDGTAERLVLAGRREDALRELAAELDGATTVVVGDIATAAGRDAILDAAGEAVAWVVLASGIPLRRPLAELAEGEIEAVYATNLVGPTLLLRRFLSLRWDAPRAITIIGSISATRSLPRRAVYGATKAGLEHLGRSLAAELGSTGVRVNIVAPGVIETPFLGDDTTALDEWARARVPVGRLGAPDEIAAAVRFVTADAPAYLTGARVVVDGGAEAVA